MGCCRKLKSKAPFIKGVSKRPRQTSAIPSLEDKRSTTTQTPMKPSLLCKYIEDKASNLKVSVTKDRQILFEVSGSTFNLEDNLRVYGCSGSTSKIVQVIKNKLDNLRVSPVTQDTTLKDLLATLIALTKNEATE